MKGEIKNESHGTRKNVWDTEDLYAFDFGGPCPVDDGSLHSLFIFRGFKGDILYQCEHDCALKSILEKRAIDVSSFVKPTDFPKHLVALQRKTIEKGLRRPVKNADVPQDGGEGRTRL